MRKYRVITAAFAFITVCLGCEQIERSASSEKAVGGSEVIEQRIYTCIRDIGVELTSDSVEAPDALVVSFISTDELVNQMSDQGNTVTLIVWKDTSTIIEDSAVYVSRQARVRKIKDKQFVVYYSWMGFRDYETNELLVITNEELRKNPQIRIKTKAGREVTFRSCQ